MHTHTRAHAHAHTHTFVCGHNDVSHSMLVLDWYPLSQRGTKLLERCCWGNWWTHCLTTYLLLTSFLEYLFYPSVYALNKSTICYQHRVKCSWMSQVCVCVCMCTCACAKYCVCVCVRACVRACVCVCTRKVLCACVCVHTCMCVHAKYISTVLIFMFVSSFALVLYSALALSS